jgi:glycosyltransferase involved in cell wall biosynthesis
VSQGQLDELSRLGFSHPRLLAIPNGVDLDRFAPGEKITACAKLALPGDAMVLGLVGRFGPFKRHEVLLAAFAEIAPQFPSAHLLFLGAGGSEEQRIRGLVAASAVRERIHLAGFQADPAASYRALDLLVIPSVNEGMSNAALEAMASGVPVLGNLGCGHEQVLTDGVEGRLADLSTPALLAGELANLLAARERLVDMGQAARMTVARRFSLTAMLDAYAQLYRASAP